MSETTTKLLLDTPTDLFVGGKWISAASGRRFDVVDPATGSTIATVADGRVEDAIAAVDAAEGAAAAWAATASAWGCTNGPSSQG